MMLMNVKKDLTNVALMNFVKIQTDHTGACAKMVFGLILTESALIKIIKNIGAMRLAHFKGGNATCSDYDECTNGIYYYSEHNTNQLNNNFDSWPPQVRWSKTGQCVESVLVKVGTGSRSTVLNIISGL